MAKIPGKRRRDINNCRRKCPYETLKEARDRAKLVRQMIHEVVLAYRCPTKMHRAQPHYHIGHPDQYIRQTDNTWKGEE